MGKIVVKFGGSNLRCKEDIYKITEVIKRYNSPLVVVISALYGITDILVDAIKKVKDDANVINSTIRHLLETHHKVLVKYVENKQNRRESFKKLRNEIKTLEKILTGIHYLGEIPEFTQDLVFSYGERLSSLILELILKYMRVRCERVLPENMGLITDAEYGNATVNYSISKNKINKNLSEEKVYVIPGFYGISPNNKITIFGRGGSDYTASAIAKCINADYVDIWKDVPGFMSADPNIVKNTKVIPQLSYREAAELSYFGAHILHPRTVEPLQGENIPIRIFNINDFPDKFSSLTIIGNNHSVNSGVIKSVTYTDDIAVLRLKGPGVGIKPGILSRVTASLDKVKINIKSVITSQTCINILLSQNDLDKSYKIVNNLELPVIDELVPVDDISLIAIVGEGILEKPGVASRVFTSVSRHNINIQVISLGASEVAGYFIIDKKDRNVTINAIHEEFFS